MGFQIGAWQNLLVGWRQPQLDLPDVFRWGKFSNTDYKHLLRSQNTLQHTYAMLYLCDVLTTRLESHVRLDEALLFRACYLHDVGEGLRHLDVCYDDKQNNDDLEEYRAFVKSFCEFDRLIWPKYHRAFLLQFVQSCPVEFPQEAISIIEDLRKNNYYEVLAFKAIERWDYLFYPLEHSSEDACLHLLKAVARNQVPKLNEIADQLPGFREEIWTPEIAAQFQTLLV